jgi:hypothetical protein
VGTSRLAALALASSLTVSGCGWSFGDPQVGEFVVNNSDRTFVLSYHGPSGSGFEYTIPPRSRGATFSTSGNEWHGTFRIMTRACVDLAILDIKVSPSLVLFAPDGTFSLITDHVEDRPDLGSIGLYETTFHCQNP